MWNNVWPNLTGYAFHACNRAGLWPSSEIGCVQLCEDVVALWTLQLSSPDGRSKLANELQSALSTDSPNAVLRSLNNSICNANPDRSNVAEICVMLLDRTRHTLAITAAGDSLPELRTPRNEIDQLDRSKTGLPLGIVPSIDYITQHVELGPSTSVFWISGDTNLISNSSGELYGFYGIPDQLKAAPREPHLTIEWIANDIKRFIGNHDQREDICMMCFQRID